MRIYCKPDGDNDDLYVKGAEVANQAQTVAITVNEDNKDFLFMHIYSCSPSLISFIVTSLAFEFKEPTVRPVHLQENISQCPFGKSFKRREILL